MKVPPITPQTDPHSASGVAESAAQGDFAMIQYDLCETLEADMQRLLRSGHGSDVHFVLPGQSRPYLAHSAVIAARCPHLRDEVVSFLQDAYQGLQTATHHVPLQITLPCVAHAALSEVLRFIYTGRIDMGTVNDIHDELLLAAWFGVTSLEDCIMEYLSNGSCDSEVDKDRAGSTHDLPAQEHADKQVTDEDRENKESEHLVELALCLNRAVQAEARVPFADRGSHAQRHVLRILTERFAPRCSRLLKLVPVHALSWEFVCHVLSQEGLDACEEDLWDWVVRYSCAEHGLIPEKRVSQMDESERARVRKRLSQVCGHSGVGSTEDAGYGNGGISSHARVRVLDIRTEFFCEEVEASGALDPRESLLKYRFDTLVDDLGVTAASSIGVGERVVAFGGSWDEFMSRVRRRSVTCESDCHPVRRGYNLKGAVVFACWVRELQIEFDRRTALDRYADIEFYADEQCKVRLFAFSKWDAVEFSEAREVGVRKSANKNGKGCRLRRLRAEVNAVVKVDGRRFWYSFYSPHLVGEQAWGFRFTTTVAR